MVKYLGVVENGQVKILEDVELPDGTEVSVTVISSADDETEAEGFPLEMLRSTIGFWADREDITDSAAFAEELRRRSQTRDHGNA